MGSARTGRNQIDITFANGLAVFRKSHTPGSTLAIGKVFTLRIGKSFAVKQRNHRLAVKRLHQIVAQAALVKPGLGFFGLFYKERHRHARHQNGFASQQVGQFCHRQSRCLKILSIGPDAHGGSRFAIALGGFTNL